MIRERMRELIDLGIQGWLAGCFGAGQKPVCAITGYPLTPENSAARFVLEYPYDVIIDTFLNHVQWDENTPLDQTQEMIWAGYFWQYAKLELIETFPTDTISEWVFQENHEQMKAMGYTRVTDGAGKETML